MLLQETRFQPLPEHLPIHGDVCQKPFMAESIKAGFDVAFENPLWTVPMAQQDMSSCRGISTAALPPKAIGMAVGLRFRDGIETQQVECLHGSIGHRGNP